jgi:hypothetical protein
MTRVFCKYVTFKFCNLTYFLKIPANTVLYLYRLLTQTRRLRSLTHDPADFVTFN